MDNDYIKEDFGLSGMLKMGAEVKITPQFAIRAGGAWQHSPAKSTLLYDEKGDGVMALNEISTAGTNTAYTVDRNVGYVTVGLCGFGLRLSDAKRRCLFFLEYL